jgi:hypothetical protein
LQVDDDGPIFWPNGVPIVPSDDHNQFNTLFSPYSIPYHLNTPNGLAPENFPQPTEEPLELSYTVGSNRNISNVW